MIEDPKILSLLRIHDACQGLSDKDVEEIAAQSEVVHVRAGELLHAANQLLDCIYLVVLGRLKMVLKSPSGEERTIRYVGAGDQFGALMLVTGDEVPIDVRADERSVLVKLPRDQAQHFGENLPVFRRNMLRKLGVAVQDSLFKRRKRTSAKIVAFIHADEATRPVASEVAARLSGANEKIGILSDAPASSFDPSIPFRSLRNSDGDYLEEIDVREIVKQWPDFDRLFIVVDRVHPVEKLVRLVELSEIVFCMGASGNPQPSIELLESMMARAPSWKKKTHFVWILEGQEQVAPLVPALENLVERDFKVQLTDPPSVTRLYDQGLNRIVHYLRGVSIGLALSGGAARGMTHLGVLKAFEESGITIDVLAGTSAGVLTGVIYCAGFSPDWGIKSFTHDLEPGSIYKKLPMGDGFYMLHKYRTKAWDKMIRKYTHDWRLEQLPIPVHTVTTDLVSARSVVRSTGDSVYAILESINLPVISAPICRDGMLLVDGGVLNNLPGDVLVKLGCNAIIGVNVSAHIEHQVGKNLPNTPTEKMKSPGAVSTMLRCLNVQAHNLSDFGADSCDIVIEPDVSQFDSAAFSRTPEMAEIGYQATMEAMPQIRANLNNLDPDLFSA